MEADKKPTGRAVAIVPREITSHGYVDLEQDDDKEGDLLSRLQKTVSSVNVRVGTK